MCVSREWGRACRGWLGSLYREFHVTLCRELYWLCMYAHQGYCLLKERLFTTNTLRSYFYVAFLYLWILPASLLLCLNDRQENLIDVRVFFSFFWLWFMALISKASFLKFIASFVFSLWFSWWFYFYLFIFKLLIILCCSGLSIDELSWKKCLQTMILGMILMFFFIIYSLLRGTLYWRALKEEVGLNSRGVHWGESPGLLMPL